MVFFLNYGGKDKKGNGTGDDLIDAAEYVYGLMGLIGFNYCANCGGDYDYTRCTPYMNGAHGGIYDAYTNLLSVDGYTRHTAANGHGSLHKLIDDCMVDYNFVTNCNYTVDKVLYKAGLMGGEGQPKSSCASKSLVNDYGGIPVFEASELHLGDIINCFDSNGNNSPNPDDWVGCWHTMYVGEETEDTVTIYETGHDYTNDGDWRREVSKDAPRSAVSSGGWVGIHLWDLDYNGNKYKGYKGNEAVVSPVTGVLLEYDTYTQEKDSITGEEYRVNVDYKYGTDSILSENGQGQSNETDVPIDKVGYAKILVLDKESYLKLEKSTDNKWKNESLIYQNGTFKENVKEDDDFKNWSSIDKTIYGYKEFLEDYETGGISGYIVYIDGFKCNLPGKLQSDKTVKDDQPIDIENYFKTVNESNLSDKKLKSLYEKEDDYKLASESATEKLNAESKIEEAASPSLYDSKNDLIFIKEGTILGRTLTDKELLDDSEYRNGEYGTYEEIRENPNDNDETAVIGNYIRVIMRDKDGTVVENVEDYMKLDEKNGKKSDKKFQISGDYDVHDESYFVDIDQFKKMFAGYTNIINNAQAFIDIQEKYQVNAVFAACVTIAESSGGTGWAAISPSTYNWFSIKGSYKGNSYGCWRAYPSFAAAVDDFGDLIANGSYYYKSGKYRVSQIGPTYCDSHWSTTVIKLMSEAYRKII